MATNLYNSFIYYECRYSYTFVDLRRTKPLNPVPYGYIASFRDPLKIIKYLWMYFLNSTRESTNKENTLLQMWMFYFSKSNLHTRLGIEHS